MSAPGQAQDATTSFATLQDWLRWQETLHFTAMELGLERCRRVAQTMQLLHPDCYVLSVAGTNGKGSSVELLRLILRRAGYRVGCYTSPHLLCYNERITIDGQQVDDAALCRSFARINQAREGISLTYFEFGTLAALDIFRSVRVDIAILEVGLGGRLDAVNILDADIALITSIDLDHQRWLGNDREQIAREKAGILRNHAPAICSDPEPPDSLLQCADALATPLLVSGRDFSWRHDAISWDWQGMDTAYRGLPRPMRFCDHQIQNAAGVLMVLEQLSDNCPVSEEDIRYGLHRFHLPGRFQIIPGEFQTILDVAHNQRSAEVLVENLRLLSQAGTTHALLGLYRDKDQRAVCEELAKVVDCWHLLSLSGERGCDARSLAEQVAACGVDGPIYCHRSAAQALDAAYREAACGDSIVITGSFVVVGEALHSLLQQSGAGHDGAGA